MLYTQTVAPETLELLKRLESEPFMDSFSLAGGTALALYLGHRVSVDLDLFTPESFDEKQLEFSLRHKYGFQTKFTAQHTLKGTIGGVKECWSPPIGFSAGICTSGTGKSRRSPMTAPG